MFFLLYLVYFIFIFICSTLLKFVFGVTMRYRISFFYITMLVSSHYWKQSVWNFHHWLRSFRTIISKNCIDFLSTAAELFKKYRALRNFKIWKWFSGVCRNCELFCLRLLSKWSCNCQTIPHSWSYRNLFLD